MLAVERPPYPLAEMTTHELAGYRRNLESALGEEECPDRDLLRRQLGAVLAEEQDRDRIARANTS